MRRLTLHRTSCRRPRPARLLMMVLLGVVLAVAALAATGAVRAGAAPPVPGPALPTPSGAPPPRSASPTSPVPTDTAMSPAPTGTATASPSDGIGGDSGDNPGLFDIAGQIRKAVDDLLLSIAQTGLKPVLDTLGSTVLSTPDLTANPQVQVLWTTTLAVANAVFVLFVIAGGFIVAARDSLQSRYGLKEIAPRVVVAGIAANASLLVCGKVIALTNAVTAAIAGQGVDGPAAATALRQMLDLKGDSLPPTLFAVLILAAVVMAIVVLITFILRAAFMVLLIGVAPLGLMCHATPQTEGLAYAWWRALAACAGIQLGQALLVLVTVRVFLTPAGTQVLGVPNTAGGLLGVLVCLTMLWLLIKLPGWMRYLVLGRLGQGRGLIGQVLHAYLQLKMLGALVGLRGGTSRSPRGTRGTGTGTSGTGTGTGTTSGPKPSPTRAGSGTPRPGGTGRGRSSRMPRSRPSPAPAGPAAFSHAPVTQTPLPAPAGTAAAPAFSHTGQPSPARPAPQGPAPGVGFSHAPATQSASAQLTANAGAASFSNAPAQATPRRATGPAPAPGFTAAPRPQSAPRRPPAPATPVFAPPSRTSSPSARSGRSVPSSPSPSRAPSSPSPSRTSSPSGTAARSVPPSRASSPSVPPSPPVPSPSRRR